MTVETAIARELNLGDTIEIQEGPYGFAVITMIKDDLVYWLRPYMISNVFPFTNTCYPYIGIEQGSFRRSDLDRYKVWRRSGTENELLNL